MNNIIIQRYREHYIIYCKDESPKEIDFEEIFTQGAKEKVLFIKLLIKNFYH